MSAAAAPHRAVSALLAVAFTLVGCTGGSLSSLRAGKSAAQPDQPTRPGGATTTAPTGIVTPSPASLPAAAQGNNARATRDPALWPFAATSPWNYPIGAHAQYAVITAGVRAPGDQLAHGFSTLRPNAVCGGTVWVGRPSDPVSRITYTSRDAGGGPTHVYNTNVFLQHVPADAAVLPGCSDHVVTLVREDHLVALDLEGASRDAAGNFRAEGLMHIDLTGPGWGGQQGPPAPNGTRDPDGQTSAGYVPVFAGIIRAGELRTGIRHALALLTSGRTKNQHAPGGQPYVWPAGAADSDYATGYGNYGNVYEGSLVAIPTSVPLASLRLRTPEALAIAQALQRYGAYLVDTGDEAPDGPDFKVDRNARADLPTDETYTGKSSATAFESDLDVIAKSLEVVTNSSNKGGQPTAPSIKIQAPGGDGTLPVPLAPRATP